MIHDRLLLLKQILDCVRPSIDGHARARCRSGFGEEWVTACGGATVSGMHCYPNDVDIWGCDIFGCAHFICLICTV